jgi:FkbM family methyltransferase
MSLATADSPSSLTRWARTFVLRAKARLKHCLEQAEVLLHIYHGNRDQGFGGSTYAQFGEDLIVLNLFHLLGITQPSYLDVGAHHPIHCSNTALLYTRGSRGINVEANPNLITAFHWHRPRDTTINVGVGPESGTLSFYFIDDWSGRNTFQREVAEEFVRANPTSRIRDVRPISVVTLNDVVDSYAGGQFPDFLSLDVEGLDFDILSSTRFDPNGPIVICVEAVTGADSDDSARIADLLTSRGYAFFVRTVANLIFVHHSQTAKLNMPTIKPSKPSCC